MSHRIPALLAGVLALAVAASSAHAIPISELHKNTSSGVPNKTGNRYTVTGVVTMPTGVKSSTNTEVAVQDSTGGMILFQSGGAGTFNLGDSISISGTVTQFNGLTELTNLNSLVLHAAGQPLPPPLVLTCQQVNQTFVLSSVDSFPEPNESRLIRINNVSVVAGSWPTTCTGQNVVLTIQDASGTTSMFIDRDSQVCGSPNPSGPFDVIGILSQFDNSAPFTTGYEIVPRFTSDIIPRTPGPSFTSGPSAVDVDTTSARIIWGTDTASTSLVEYGFTTSYGSSKGDSTPVTSHSVQLTGLTPGRLYHARVASSDGSGTRVSNDITFVTQSTTPGSVNVYFSHSVDHSLAAPESAQGNVNLAQPIINRINLAQNDVSAAIYSFNLSTIADALIAAWNRGVKVRVVLDADVAQTQADRLRNAGIPVITSTFGGNHAGGGIHHNKFFVFDARDGGGTNDWVWTGSVNMTTQNMADMNNGIEIQDTGLAQAYLLEFNEMWGSDTDVANASLSRIGNTKSNNTPHTFNIGGMDLELWFSPSDGTEAQIVNSINTANHRVLFAQSVFTSDPIALALRNKYNSIPGFAVRGVFDAGNSGQQGSEWAEMKGIGGSNPWSPPADVWLDTEPNDLHHKYGIVDEGYLSSDPRVITGSHNWTNAANTVNDENTLIFKSQRMANLFLQEFAKRYQAAGGSGMLQVVGVGDQRLPSGLALRAPWPNPTRGGGVIAYALPGEVAPDQRVALRLYDLRGAVVRTLVDATAEPGPQRVSFDGRDGRGVRLAPGVYFLRLEALGTSLSQKWVVLE